MSKDHIRFTVLCGLLLVVMSACLQHGVAQATTPDTPAGRTLETWLGAFNSGDRARLEAYVNHVDRTENVDGMSGFRQQTGGFELLSIESSEPLHIRFRVKEKNGPGTALGNLLVKDGQPPTVVTFGYAPCRPGRSSRM